VRKAFSLLAVSFFYFSLLFIVNSIEAQSSQGPNQFSPGDKTTQGANVSTPEKKLNLTVRPFINCDLNPSVACIGTERSDTILGGKFPDQIQGLGGSDWINGSGGNDIVLGYGSDDIIYGDNGNDILMGHDGSDKILGGYGSDKISGGPGDDVIYQGPDGYEDYIDCGSGNDEVQGATPLDVDIIQNCEKVKPYKP
jgi:Ca2+-binding RTX toxin-like protein